jgi:hypothetical protein
MTGEIIVYRGYELRIDPGTPEHTVIIRAQGRFQFLAPPNFHSPGISRREQLINEAKAVVDALIDLPHTKKAD